MKYQKLWWNVLVTLVLTAAILLMTNPTYAQASAVSGPTLIIDAGHGGEDGGAVAPDGTLESDLNLDIALRLEALASFWGVKTEMTRSTAAIAYPADAETLSAKKKADQNARVEQINSVPDGVLLSIHQNIYPAQAPWGIQVFYGTEPESDILAAQMQENLTAQLCPENRRIAEPIDDGIYLMRRAECRAILVECGFLSNPSDLGKLSTDSYRTELAAVMLATYLQYIRGSAL